MQFPINPPLLAIAATMVLGSCGKDSSVGPPPVANVSITPSQVTLLLGPSGGESRQLVAGTLASNGSPIVSRVISWSSSSPATAMVDGTGRVTAIAVGTATVTATSEGKSASASITVAPVPVASLTITAPATSLYTGQTLQLAATTKDSTGASLSGRTLTWTASDTTIARVSNLGLVTAVATGTASITATSEGKSAATTLTLVYDAVAGVAVTPTTEVLIVGVKKGQSKQLRATISVLSGQLNASRPTAWTSSDSTIVSVSATGTVTAKKNGTVTITATSEGKSATASVQAGSTFDTTVPLFLSNVAADAKQILPIIEIRFLPTDDGVMLDTVLAPSYSSFDSRTLEQITRELDSLDIKKKYALEEGSRFRGYGYASAAPSVAFKVVKLFTIYRTPPTSLAYPYADGAARVDYTKLFADLGVIALINSLNVKEVWMHYASWGVSFPVYANNPNARALFDLNTRFSIAESAMSSPRGECVSNSYREDCLILPKADHTYLVYGDYYRRGWSCAVHNRGHQFEVMFRNRDRDVLFDRRFTGYGADGKIGTGRAGNTHNPPNTTVGYDYWNKTLVASDIETWLPVGGATKLVNHATWDLLPYRYADDDNCGGRWLTYWMQHFHNFNSGITLDGKLLENWWELYANWDTWATQNRSLVKNSPAQANATMRAFVSPSDGMVFEPATDYPAPLRKVRP